MKIGIDISQIVHQGTGAAIYTQNIVKNLLTIDKKNEYLFFGSSLRLKRILYDYCATACGNHERRIYSFPPVFLEFLWNRWHKVLIERFTGRLDIFHASDWLEPPSKCPKITTIHDLAIFKYPETFAPRGGHDIVANLRRKLEWTKKETELIIAVSRATKQDIIELLGILPEKIRVVYEAAGEEFYPREKEEIENVRRKYQIDGDYILAVGTWGPRKNLKRVIGTYSILVSQYPYISLVIAGKYGWGEDKLEIKSEKLKILGYIPQEDLASLYSGALCFVYPSLYEGFGLPILEAMACGCPVVTSNVSSMPEVAGNAAVLVDPLSVKSITKGIKKAIDRREEMVKRGYERVKKFSWERCARETLEVYEEAARM